jgi:hypothetical protein
MSEAPAESLQSVRPAPSLSIEKDADGDDIMIKIDPFDAAFEFDSDSPPPEEELPKPKKRPKQKPKSKQKHSSKQTKPIYISSSSPSSNSSSSPLQQLKTHPTIDVTRPSKQTPIIQMQGTKSKPKFKSKPQATIEVCRVPSINPTHARETSSDRDFIVPDNVLVYISDKEGDDDDDLLTSTRHEVSDVDMLDDDGLDLDIDMQPRYAFNRKLLWKARGTRQ